MHPRFDLKKYYSQQDIPDYLKETLNINLTSNFKGFEYTGSAFSKAYWENLQQKSIEIVGIRVQNILNPDQKLQTSDLSLKLMDPSSRRVVFASYSNLATSSLKFYVPGPFIWLNGGHRKIEVTRGMQTSGISVEVQGGSLDDLEILFDLQKIDQNSSPQAWDTYFDNKNKEYSDFEEDSWFNKYTIPVRPEDSFTLKSGLDYDSWVNIFGTRNGSSTSSTRSNVHSPDTISRDVSFGVGTQDIDLALGTSASVTPTPSDDTSSSTDASYLGVRSENRLVIFLNSFERDLIVKNQTTFYFEDRQLLFSPEKPVFNLFLRHLQQPFEYLPYQEKLISWEYCTLPFPSFDKDYLYKNYGRETFKTTTPDPTTPTTPTSPPSPPSLESISIPGSFHYQVPRESSILFWPLKLRLPLGVFRKEFKISFDRNFPLGNYKLIPILKKTKQPLIYTRLDNLDLKVLSVDSEKQETFTLSDPQTIPQNLTNSPNPGLQLKTLMGRHPIKILFNNNLYLNGETLPILVMTSVAIDTVLYLDFYYKTELPFMRPVPQRVVLTKSSPRALRNLGFSNSKAMFLNLPTAKLKLTEIGSSNFYLEESTIDFTISEDKLLAGNPQLLGLDVNTIRADFESVDISISKVDASLDVDVFFYLKAKNSDVLNLKTIELFFIDNTLDNQYFVKENVLQFPTSIDSSIYWIGRLLLFSPWTTQSLSFKSLFADTEYELHLLAYNFDQRNINRVLSFEFKTKEFDKAGLITLETKRFTNGSFLSDEILQIQRTIAEVSGCPKDALRIVDLPFNGTVDLSNAQDIFPREQFSYALFPQMYFRRFKLEYLDTKGVIKSVSSNVNLTASSAVSSKLTKMLSLDYGENYYEQFWNGAVQESILNSKELFNDPDSRFSYFPFNIYRNSPPKVSLEDKQEYLQGEDPSSFRLPISPLEVLFILDSKWKRIYQQIPNLLSVDETAKHYGNYGYYEGITSLPEFSLPSKIFIAKNYFTTSIPKSTTKIPKKNSTNFSASLPNVTSHSSEILNPLTNKKFNFLIGVYEPPTPSFRAPPELIYSLGTHFYYNVFRNLISIESINSFLGNTQKVIEQTASEKDIMMRVVADAKGFIYTGIFDVEEVTQAVMFNEFYKGELGLGADVTMGEVAQRISVELQGKNKVLLDAVVKFLRGKWKKTQIVHFMDFRDKIMNTFCKGVVLDIRKPMELFCDRIITNRMFVAVTVLGSPNVYSKFHLADSDAWDFQFFIVAA